jgi:hypothetical protein
MCSRELRKSSDRSPSFVRSFQPMAECTQNLRRVLKLVVHSRSLELSVRFQSAKNRISLHKENKDNGNNKINKRNRRVGRRVCVQRKNPVFLFPSVLL